MKVISNTAISIDGRIATVDRQYMDVASPLDKRRMSLIRAQADAVLVGGQTFRVGPIPLIEMDEDAAQGVRRPMINAVLTRRGLLEASGDGWPNPQVDLHIFGGSGFDADAHREQFAATIHQNDEPTVEWVLDALEALGCETVLVEGGGDLIFQVIASHRLDSLYVTLAPRVIGGVGAPSLADGKGFAVDAIRDFELAELERVGSELFLRYDSIR